MCVWYTVASEVAQPPVLTLGLNARVCYNRSWFPGVRHSEFLCLSHTMPGYSMNVVPAVGWCFVHHQATLKNPDWVLVQKILHKKMFIGNDTISEIVNDLDSDGANFSELSGDMCKARPVPVAMRRSTAARLLRLWVRIPPGARMFVCCVCCVLSGRGLHLSKRSPTDCGTSLCVIKKPHVTRWPRKNRQSCWVTPVIKINTATQDRTK
jgi:hypothetical protein